MFTVAIFHSFSTHSVIIFHFILIPFFSKMKVRMKKKMNVKWNPTLAFAKRGPKNDHFSSFWQCAWWEKCIFTSFFLFSLPRMFIVTIFHTIFHFIFSSLLCFCLPNTWKWAKNEFENEPKMSQEWLLWTTLFIYQSEARKVPYSPKTDGDGSSTSINSKHAGSTVSNDSHLAGM